MEHHLMFIGADQGKNKAELGLSKWGSWLAKARIQRQIEIVPII